MTTEKEKSLSDSLLNNSSIQHGYGSLGIFHTPPLPGADHTATHIDSPVSINDDFLLNSHGSISPHFNEFASSHFTFKNTTITKRREQSLTISAPYAITPQHSGIASSTYSESPLSHTDYVKHTTTNNNKYLNTNQLYQYQHPYFNNINNNYPIYNEIFDTIPSYQHQLLSIIYMQIHSIKFNLLTIIQIQILLEIYQIIMKIINRIIHYLFHQYTAIIIQKHYQNVNIYYR